MTAVLLDLAIGLAAGLLLGALLLSGAFVIWAVWLR
jgi:hypothetical protein